MILSLCGPKLMRVVLCGGCGSGGGRGWGVRTYLGSIYFNLSTIFFSISNFTPLSLENTIIKQSKYTKSGLCKDSLRLRIKRKSLFQSDGLINCETVTKYPGDICLLHTDK